ncbi:MAG: nuclear transport factor 2 family protein [Boseongicola sp. SB0673_bin_14]|nr:nuclear transport factor 2 family protein [Boseongicola sp. SB0667_bin_21]MYI69549.1 nuclear transport factor 2 family protein [Boseongicola sp. SB0673_bin_14]
MSDLQSAKEVVRAFYDALDHSGPSGAADAMAGHCAPDLVWRGCHPFNQIIGSEQVAERFWVPLKTSLTSLKRRLDLFFAGHNQIDGFETVWVGTMGHLMGLFDEPWIGIRPTGKIAMLRYAAFHRVAADSIAETAMYFDIPHLMLQAGVNHFAPQTGAHLVQPGPMTHDGLLYDLQEPSEGEATLSAINAMLGDICSWDAERTEPLVDELRRTWNEDMVWWGPAGIGATYTIPRYAEQHSGPFRSAFRTRRFSGDLAMIAEGRFGGLVGWPNLTLKHDGGFMGMPVTDREADMRVIDMYRREGGKLTENWVFIDLLHFWNMQGLDVLGRMEAMDPVHAAT